MQPKSIPNPGVTEESKRGRQGSDEFTRFERDLEEWQRPRRIDDGISDRSIEEELRDHLACDPEIDASEISLRVDNGEITLDGTVGRASMKRAAERCARVVPGVRQIHNQLRVRRGSRPNRAGHPV